MKTRDLYRSSFRPLVTGAIVCMVMPVALVVAQTNFGQINGTVRDQSGKVISGATITLTDLDKNNQRQATSSSDGNYVIPSVPPGRYSLSTTMPGFEKYVVPEFTLEVNEARTIDVQ